MLAKAGMLLADITDAPQYEAERLLSFILKKPRTFLRAWPDHLLLEDQVNAFFALISRRQQGEPLAYIVGQKDFYDISLVISNAVLVPRPETELLVDTILSLPISQTAIQFADLGTGSGAIALSIAKARPYWQVHAVDISPEALAVAKQNADSLELSHVSFHQGSWLSALPRRDFTIIASNPPYLSEIEWPDFAAGLQYEPRLALVSGLEGLDAITDIAQQARQFLLPGGYLLLEHGYQQGEKVRSILQQAGYKNIVTRKDYAGHERLTFGSYLPIAPINLSHPLR
jgi:release factor glutamine methyltransferase